jgi:DNA polymerase-3 subunit gamma/tau
MAHQVLARKWRPKKFSDLVGQHHVTQTLENAIRADRVAHAYIFAGVRGVGKTTTARILAKALNCVKGPTTEPCNECAACLEIAAGTSLDVLEIDAASNRGIDQIRELRDMVRYAAAGGRYKIVILDEAHQLTDDASNALLKTLEEPPDKVVFILATTQAEKLGDTIRSRTQLFQFRSLSFNEISGALTRIAKEEKLEIEPGALAVLARAAEGSLRDSLSLLEQAIAYSGDHITDAQVRELLGVVAEEFLDELIAAIQEQSAERALGLVHRLITEGHNLQHFCRESIRHLRNLLVAKVCGAESELIAAPSSERARLAKQSALFSEEDLTRFFQIALVTDDDLRRKPDPRVHLELGLLKLVTAKRLAPLEDVLGELRRGSSMKPGPGGRSFAAAAGAESPRFGSPSGSSSSSFSSASSSSFSSSFSSPPAPSSGSTNPYARTSESVGPRMGFGAAISGASPYSKPSSTVETQEQPREEMSAAVAVQAEAPSYAASAQAETAARTNGESHGEEVAEVAAAAAASAVAAEPAAATETQSASSASEVAISGIEPEQLAAIQSSLQSQKFLWSMIEHVTRWEREGNEMRLFFPAERRALAEMLQGRDAMERLRTVVSKVIGQPLRLCVKLDSAQVKPQRGSDLRGRFEEDPIVRAMLERFGGRISEVRPRSEE